MALHDIMTFAEMAYEIANTEGNQQEEAVITAGLDAEIAEISRDFQGFIEQTVENIQISHFLASGEFVEGDSVTINVEDNKTENTAGLDAEIEELVRDLLNSSSLSAKDIQQLEVLVSASAHFTQDDIVASQAPVEVNYLAQVLALSIPTL